MNTKIETGKINQASLWLWGIAILAVFIMIGLLGWRGFYGFVVPQASNTATLPLVGVIGFSLLAGGLSFFAPCPFAVFPAYAAFFLADQKNEQYSKVQALRFAAVTSVGVIGFYVLLGVILASLGTQVAFYTNYLKFAVIFLIFLFGLSLLFGKQLPSGFLDQWTNSLSTKIKNWGSLGYGVIYAIAGAACFLPVILTIALIPIFSGNFVNGFVAFVSYGLGISFMLTLATLLLASGRQKLLQSMAGKAAGIKKLSGGILVATALFLVAFYIQTGM